MRVKQCVCDSHLIKNVKEYGLSRSTKMIHGIAWGLLGQQSGIHGIDDIHAYFRPILFSE